MIPAASLAARSWRQRLSRHIPFGRTARTMLCRVSRSSRLAPARRLNFSAFVAATPGKARPCSGKTFRACEERASEG